MTKYLTFYLLNGRIQSYVAVGNPPANVDLFNWLTPQIATYRNVQADEIEITEAQQIKSYSGANHVH